jgi:hypothetical protein
MIRAVFYTGSMLIIGLFCYNQYLDYQDYLNTPVITEYKVDNKIKEAMKYHGIRSCTKIYDENGKEYYVFIRNGKVYNLLDFEQFPNLRRKLNEK